MRERNRWWESRVPVPTALLPGACVAASSVYPSPSKLTVRIPVNQSGARKVCYKSEMPRACDVSRDVFRLL